MDSPTTALWPAIYRGRTPVDLRVEIPGSKSVTNRALILAAQAKSTSIGFAKNSTVNYKY